MRVLVLVALLGAAIAEQADSWDDEGWAADSSMTAAGSWDEGEMKHHHHEEHHDNHYHHCADGERMEHHCEWDRATHTEHCYESCVSGCEGVRRRSWNQDAQEEELLCFEGDHAEAHDGRCPEGQVATWTDHNGQVCMDAHPKPECPRGSRPMWGEGHEMCVPSGKKMECHGYKVHHCDHSGCQEYCNTDDEVYKVRPIAGSEREIGHHEGCNWDDGERDIWENGMRYCVKMERCDDGMMPIHAGRRECDGSGHCEHWWGMVCARSHPRPRCPPGQVRSWDHEKQMDYCAKVGEKLCEGGYESHQCDENGCSEYCVRNVDKMDSEKRPRPEHGCDHESGEEQWGTEECHDGECHYKEYCVRYKPCQDGEMGIWAGRMEGEGHEHRWWHGKVCVAASEHPTCPEGSRREWDNHAHEERCVEQGRPMHCDGYRSEGCDQSGCHQYCMHDAWVPGVKHEEPKHECNWETDRHCRECDWDKPGMEMNCNEHGCKCVIYEKCEGGVKTWAQRPDGSHGPVCMQGERKQGCHKGSMQEWDHHNHREVCVGNGWVLERRPADKREMCNGRHSDMEAGNDDCCTLEFPCGMDEGNCNSDDQCHEGLVCGAPCSWNEGDTCCSHPPMEELTGAGEEDWQATEEAALMDLEEDALNADMDHRSALHELANWYISLKPADHGRIEQVVKEHDGDVGMAMEKIADHYGFEGIKRDVLLRMAGHLMDEEKAKQFEEHMQGHEDMHAGIHSAVDMVADSWEQEDMHHEMHAATGGMKDETWDNEEQWTEPANHHHDTSETWDNEEEWTEPAAGTASYHHHDTATGETWEDEEAWTEPATNHHDTATGETWEDEEAWTEPASSHHDTAAVETWEDEEAWTEPASSHHHDNETYKEEFEEAEAAALQDLHEDAKHTDYSHREALKDMAHWYMGLSQEEHAKLEEMTEHATSMHDAFEKIADHYQIDGVKREAFMRLGKHLEEEMASGSSRFHENWEEHGLDHAVGDVADQWEGVDHHTQMHHLEDEKCETNAQCGGDLICGVPCSWDMEATCCGKSW